MCGTISYNLHLGLTNRLQQNWKVKRHRMAATPGNEGFYIDLFDNSLYDPAASFRPSTMSTVWVEHDAAGMLAINLPQKAVRSLQFGFLCRNSDTAAIQASRIKAVGSDQDPAGECKKEPESDDDCVKNKHAILREVHRAIFDEQVSLFALYPLHTSIYSYVLLFLNLYRCLIW